MRAIRMKIHTLFPSERRGDRIRAADRPHPDDD
jgi:hypothetical protein